MIVGLDDPPAGPDDDGGVGVVGLAMEGGFFGGNLIWQVMAAYKGLKREDNSLANCKIWIIGFLNEAQNPRQARDLMIRHTETPFCCHLHHIAPLIGMLYHLLIGKESKNRKSKKKKKKMLLALNPIQ